MGDGVVESLWMLEARLPQKYYKNSNVQKSTGSGLVAANTRAFAPPNHPQMKRSDEPRHQLSVMQVGDNSMSSLCSFGASAQAAVRPEREMRGTGERRLSQRYEVDLAIRVRVLSPSTASEWCVGTVLDLSSTGVSFQCHHPFPVNTRIEMVIDWPLKQSALHPICLCASGHVVRSDDKTTAARMTSCRMGIEKATSPPGRV